MHYGLRPETRMAVHGSGSDFHIMPAYGRDGNAVDEAGGRGVSYPAMIFFSALPLYRCCLDVATTSRSPPSAELLRARILMCSA